MWQVGKLNWGLMQGGVPQKISVDGSENRNISSTNRGKFCGTSLCIFP